MENNAKLPEDVGAAMRDKLMSVFSKKTLANEPSNSTYEVKDFLESKAKVQEVALKAYALHSASMIQYVIKFRKEKLLICWCRKFREEFKYKQMHKIFGNYEHNEATDHMKSMLEGYCK